MDTVDLERFGVRLPKDALDFARATQELAKLDATIQQEESDIAAQRERLDARKADRQALTDLRNSLAHFLGDASTKSAATAAHGGGAKRATKREAIRALLSDGQEWNAPAIHASLVEQGVHATAAYSSLLSTLSEMYSDDELVRVRQGIYRLAPEGALQE